MKTTFHSQQFLIIILCLVIMSPLEADINRQLDDPNNFVFTESQDSSDIVGEDEDVSVGWFQTINEWPREKKVAALNLAVAGSIIAVGISAWDYGSSSFRFHNEGWFGRDTKYGGADKLGHAYGTYVLATLYKNIYQYWGYSEEEALTGGVLSSWSQMTLMEFADGFSSEHGFSWEDEMMDVVGAGMAYLRHRFPSLKDKVDYRLEWLPSSALRRGDQSDPFTDYSGQKYLIALKPDGFLKTNNPYLKAMEIHFGYYTRGYEENDSHHQHRSTYVGLGLNVTYLIEQLTGHDAWRAFDYIQVPYTYLSTSSEFH